MELLELSWQLQLALGSGYLAYLIACSGLRQHHTATDTIFQTVVFGIIANSVLQLTPEWPLVGLIYWKAASAVILTIAAGMVWRWRAARWVKARLRKANILWSDDIPTAWLAITARETDCYPSQIAVDLEDGRTLLCDETSAFADSPYGPCTYGLDGSIAMYVTDERRPDGTWFEHDDAHHLFRGDNITFVPANQVRRVEMRLWRKTNGLASREADWTAKAEAERAASEAEQCQEFVRGAGPSAT